MHKTKTYLNGRFSYQFDPLEIQNLDETLTALYHYTMIVAPAIA